LVMAAICVRKFSAHFELDELGRHFGSFYGIEIVYIALVYRLQCLMKPNNCQNFKVPCGS